MSNFGRFCAIFAILISKIPLISYIIAHAIFCEFSGDPVWKSRAVGHFNNTGILYAVWAEIFAPFKQQFGYICNLITLRQCSLLIAISFTDVLFSLFDVYLNSS